MKKTDEFTLEPYHRRSIRLKGYDYSLPGGYFVTLVSYQRESIFGKITGDALILNDYGKTLISYWKQIPEHYNNVDIDSFILMPNHLHGIFFISDLSLESSPIDNVGAGYQPALLRRYPLSEIIRNFKTHSSRKINEKRHLLGVPVWQRNYYEHIIRNNEELNDIRQYINNNIADWNKDEENPGLIP
jgi:putative transposase